jgi:hypothetical protein
MAVDALGRDRRILFCLGQNEHALDGSLRVEREAFRCSLPFDSTLPLGLFNV